MPLKGRRQRTEHHRMATAGGGSTTSHTSTSTEYKGARKTTHQQHQMEVKSASGDTDTYTSESTRAGINAPGVAANAGAGIAQTGANAATAPVQYVGSHSHGGVLLFALLLLAFSTWDGFSKPMLDKIWNGTTAPTPIDGRLILGGVVFAFVLAMVADSNDAAGTLISVMLAGLWLIFLLENGIALKNGQKVPSGAIVNFFSWFSAHSQTSTKTGG